MILNIKTDYISHLKDVGTLKIRVCVGGGGK